MDIIKLSAVEIALKIQQREITAMDTAQAFIKQIKKVEDCVDAFLYFNENEVLSTAKKVQLQIEDLLKEKKPLPPLAGVPIAIKDNICTKGIATTCASKMLEGFVPSYDATVIDKLKKNLLIPIGKLNMDEFAMGSSNEYSAIKNTKNPWNIEYVPGGSSGASAASVASLMAPLSIGSDTGGSVRQPAAFCGITGLRPTYGRVSRYGLVAFASSLDQIGPLAKDAASCSALFDIISGADDKDSTSQKDDYLTTYDKINDFKKPTIALVDEYMNQDISPEMRSTVKNIASMFKKMGCNIINISIPSLKYALSAYYVLSSAEASSNLSRYDGVRYGHRTQDAKTIDELYIKSRSQGFGEEVKRRIMLGTYALSSGYYDKYYDEAQKARTLIKHEFKEAFKKTDLILCPTTSSTAFKFGTNINDTSMYMADFFTVGASLAGLPASSFVGGFNVEMLPLGMQLIGPYDSESILMSSIHAFQLQTDYHKMTPEGI
jgi:aspartyl-tRNA(Asn)/glutamyl-tRNA(Gln) amidotransferase subunit A